MRNSYATPAREFAPGMGQAVADRTVARLLDRKGGRVLNVDEAKTALAAGTGYRETWEDVAKRVAIGNCSLAHDDLMGGEFHAMHHHLRQASLLMSGRHLQHGDVTQLSRPQEVFTNCSTSAASFLTFYLLLNGSGVGRAYDDAMMAVDYNLMPVVVPVIDHSHADVQSGDIKFFDRRSAEHLYSGRRIEVFEVPDSREGWAKAVERIELLTFTRFHRDTVLLIDFSGVRPKGSPIKGMQNRPASGPLPLMVAIAHVARLRDAGMAPWRAAMYADHYFAECVLVGGARRAARMATKTWRDRSVLDFIGVKRGSFLWSSNNSVTVDEEFWKLVRGDLAEIARFESDETYQLAVHAKRVFEAICEASYHDGTGEPGIINVDKLNVSTEGLADYRDGDFAGSARYQLDKPTLDLTRDLAARFMGLRNKAIVNPCGEIPLSMLGGYCVIADVVPYHAGSNLAANGVAWADEQQKAWDDDAEDAFRVATRALMRTNLMDSLYDREVKRTNRIGVGFTGIHEYAWARFGYGWEELVDEGHSKPFWLMLSRFKRAVQDEAERYAGELGVAVPDTNTTVKPAGTTSKLFGLTEGAHLPSMREYLRWVQFRSDDPLVAEYRAKGYPVRELTVYGGTTIVGFPTQPEICKLGMGDALVTAAEATMEEQYEWIRLLEKYWLRGVEEDGVTPLYDRGGQVSYTAKYDPSKVSYDDFRRMLLNGQSRIKCCSVMPQTDTSAYEYQPEQPVTKAEFEQIAEAIAATDVKEDVGFEHVDCASGACPIDFERKAA